MATTTKKPRLSWRTPQNELPGTVDLYLGGSHVGRVHPSSVKERTHYCDTPWYFSARGGRNSLIAGEKIATVEEAKRALLSFVRGEVRAGRM